MTEKKRVFCNFNFNNKDEKRERELVVICWYPVIVDVGII